MIRVGGVKESGGGEGTAGRERKQEESGIGKRRKEVVMGT